MAIYKKRVNPEVPGNYETYKSGDFICCCDVVEGGGKTGHNGDPALLAADGWMLVIPPTYNTDTHRLSDSADEYTDNGVNAYRVTVQLLPAELAANLAGLKTVAREQVKFCRQNTLDYLARSAGVSEIYAENRKASEMILAGQGESVLFGAITASQFAADAGANLGMSGANWAAFIKGENDRERLRGKRIEEGYLHYYYGLLPAALDRAAVEAAGQGYQDFCSALLAAADTAAILAVVGP